MVGGKNVTEKNATGENVTRKKRHVWKMLKVNLESDAFVSQGLIWY